MDDLIIKTIISAENLICNGVKMFVPHRNNCFELFGFDILIDEDLKPWLLEVNLTPSLMADSDMDFEVKSTLLADTFSLAGIFSTEYKQKYKKYNTNKQIQNMTTFNDSEVSTLLLKKNFLQKRSHNG